MYTLLSQLSQFMSKPIVTFLNSYEHSPIVIALLLGLIGSLAPCQLTGNISAITLYGNRSLQRKGSWIEISYFIIGKVIVFSVIGICAWLFGQAFETEINTYFPYFRKAIGPLLILTGLVLIGVIKLRWIDHLTRKVTVQVKSGKLGSLLLGASFSIAFCPTMFVLFFVWLMPTVVTTSYGMVLPVIFGVATSVPVLVVLLLIRSFDSQKIIMRNSRKVGKIVQVIAGLLLLGVGLLDAFTYWG